MAVQTLAGISAAQRTILEDELLLTAFPRLIHGRWGKRRVLAPKEGRAVTFARHAGFQPAIAALSEGVASEGEALSFTTVTVTPSRYGSFAYLSDELVDKGIFAIATDVTSLLGAQAGRSSDRLARAMLVANGSTQTADDVAEASQTTANVMDAEEILEALATLQVNDALPFDELGGEFPLLMYPHVFFDVQRDPMIRNSFYYAAQRGPENPALAGMSKGSWMGVRFFVSSDAYVNANGGSGSINTYHSLMIGQEFYCIAGFGALLAEYQEGQGTFHPGAGYAAPVELIVHGREAYPPLNQRESIAWKIDQGQAQLNSTFMIRLITCSSLST